MDKKNHFKGKTVVVTGGASGIGLAVCERFAVAGSKIGILDMDKKGVESVGSKFECRGIDCRARVCDVTSENDCRSAVADMIRYFGGIDVLVNNAGVTQRSLVINTDIAVYRRVMDINFFGSVNCTKPAIESIIQRKGQVIVISSIAGTAPLLGRSGYCASKHALNGFFTTLRTEIKGFGAHVMVVCPGFVKTNLQTRALGGDGKVTRRPRTTMGKADTPERVAREIFQGAVKRKDLLVLTPVGKFGYYISRFAPALYEKMMAKKFAAELAAK